MSRRWADAHQGERGKKRWKDMCLPLSVNGKKHKAKILSTLIDRIFALVRQKGLEPPTFWFVAKHSIQLSYWRILSHGQLSNSSTAYEIMQVLFSNFEKILSVTLFALIALNRATPQTAPAELPPGTGSQGLQGPASRHLRGRSAGTPPRTWPQPPWRTACRCRKMR